MVLLFKIIEEKDEKGGIKREKVGFLVIAGGGNLPSGFLRIKKIGKEVTNKDRSIGYPVSRPQTRYSLLSGVGIRAKVRWSCLASNVRMSAGASGRWEKF